MKSLDKYLCDQLDKLAYLSPEQEKKVVNIATFVIILIIFTTTGVGGYIAYLITWNDSTRLILEYPKFWLLFGLTFVPMEWIICIAFPDKGLLTKQFYVIIGSFFIALSFNLHELLYN